MLPPVKSPVLSKTYKSFSLSFLASVNGSAFPYLSAFSPLSKKEGNNWRTICEGTDTRQDEKRQRSVSGPDKSIRDAIPYSAVSPARQMASEFAEQPISA